MSKKRNSHPRARGLPAVATTRSGPPEQGQDREHAQEPDHCSPGSYLPWSGDLGESGPRALHTFVPGRFLEMPDPATSHPGLPQSTSIGLDIS